LCAAFAELATRGGLFWPIARKIAQTGAVITHPRTGHRRASVCCGCRYGRGRCKRRLVVAQSKVDRSDVLPRRSVTFRAAKRAMLGVLRATSCTFSRTVSTISRSAFCSPVCFSRRQKPSRDAIHNRGGGSGADRSFESLTFNPMRRRFRRYIAPVFLCSDARVNPVMAVPDPSPDAGRRR
jgi:hypothetical protein